MKTPPIRIIYNPNSTGPSRQDALELMRELRTRYKGIDVRTMRTKYAGHGEEIGREYALKGKPMILISSSGDGGYHDLINGVLSVPRHKVITGLLPGGNANDHYHALHRGDTLQRLRRADADTIDVIRVEVQVNGRPWTRYAHSYAGIGLTAHIGEALTKTKLNRVREVWIVITHLFTHSPVRITVDGKSRRYDSIIFSNIPRMSKVITLADDALVTDGKMEVTELETRNVWTMLTHLVRGATRGFKTERRTDRYEFRCRRRTAMQLDGEVYYFAARTTVTVSVEPKRLQCII